LDHAALLVPVLVARNAMRDLHRAQAVDLGLVERAINLGRLFVVELLRLLLVLLAARHRRDSGDYCQRCPYASFHRCDHAFFLSVVCFMSERASSPALSISCVDSSRMRASRFL